MELLKDFYNFDKKIILASKSPRRKKLLEQIGIDFEVLVSNSDETFAQELSPEEIVTQIAKRKAECIVKIISEPAIIIGADTIVVLDGLVLGKPETVTEAYEMLKKLSGKKHYVYTGICLIDSNTSEVQTHFEKTLVEFRELSDKEILTYISTGSPMDKAGAYGIQDDFGAVFIKRIEGCYYNVVGLPLSLIFTKLIQYSK